MNCPYWKSIEIFTIGFQTFWKSLYKRFARGFRATIWHSIFAELAEDADFEEVFIDSTIVRVHKHAPGYPKKKGNQSMGRSRGGLTTKIHALVDGLGMLAHFSLTIGQTSDTGEAFPLLDDMLHAI